MADRYIQQTDRNDRREVTDRLIVKMIYSRIVGMVHNFTDRDIQKKE